MKTDTYKNVSAGLKDLRVKADALYFVAPEYTVEGVFVLDDNGCNIAHGCGSNAVLLTSNPTQDGKKTTPASAAAVCGARTAMTIRAERSTSI